MKKWKKSAILLSAVLALSSCGSNPKAEAIEKTRDAIMNDKNYDQEYERLRYSTYRDGDFKLDVYLSASSEEQNRFDAVSFWNNTGLYGRLDVVFTDNASPEGYMRLGNYDATQNYFVSQFTLTDEYKIGSNSFKLDYYKVYNPEYVSFSNGRDLLTLALEITLMDTKYFMSEHGIDIKTFLLNA